jgi:hypothetical protein
MCWKIAGGGDPQAILGVEPGEPVVFLPFY